MAVVSFCASCVGSGAFAANGQVVVRKGTSAKIEGPVILPPGPSQSEEASALSDQSVSDLFQSFGLGPEDYPGGRPVRDGVRQSIGFVVFDRSARRVVLSYNADAPFYLASTTKLFTVAMVGAEFGGDPFLVQHRAELEQMLLDSEDREASTWLLLARDHHFHRPTDFDGWTRRIKGECYGKPERDAVQRGLEHDAAKVFFDAHQAAYPIGWKYAQIVDGAGCERGETPDKVDRMTPRQYLTVLDSLRLRDFGGWNAFRLLPQRRHGNDRPLATKVDGRGPADAGVFAWKDGGDNYGIRNIAGYLPKGGDPFAYYFVLLINTGRSPRGEVGLKAGTAVLDGFAAWAAQSVGAAPAVSAR
jgi:hypothetical protein